VRGVDVVAHPELQLAFRRALALLAGSAAPLAATSRRLPIQHHPDSSPSVPSPFYSSTGVGVEASPGFDLDAEGEKELHLNTVPL